MSVSANQIITRADDCRHGHRSAAVHHYEGCLAFINASGYADNTTNSGANPFAGINVKEVDNSGGSAGDLNDEVFAEGRFLLTGTGFTQASVGLRAYATDNYTIGTDATASGAVPIGEVVGYVDSTHVYVSIEVFPLKLFIEQQAAYTQTYSTAARTVPNATAVAVVTTAATNSSPYGFAQAQADAIPVAINALEADVLALKKVITALIDDLQAVGIAG